MEKICVVCDFDGTITERDTLYSFFEEYAVEEWKIVEELWVENKISSKECLIKEFELVPNLSEKLIDKFLESMTIDKDFKKFCSELKSKNIDIYIVSDGVDYFINKVLKKFNISEIDIISNHGEFVNGKFTLSFPNDNKNCPKDSGTCKCKVITTLKEKYETVIYAGDGVSDFCSADKADILYAKKRLLTYCKENGIKYIPYNTFKDIKI